MELGEFNESVEDLIEETDLTVAKAKLLKLRIVEPVYGAVSCVRTDEKEIVGIRLDVDAGELILTLSPKEIA